MVKLAAWTIDRQRDEDTARQSGPRKVERSHIGLEKHLEDWIAKDVTLIGEGLTLVGRQVRIDDGILGSCPATWCKSPAPIHGIRRVGPGRSGCHGGQLDGESVAGLSDGFQCHVSS